MTQRDPPHDAAILIRVADFLDPGAKRVEIEQSEASFAALVLRNSASLMMKSDAASGRPVRPEPS